MIEGGLAADDRGTVSFVNGFQFEGVKRFYAVSNHRSGFIRAWHGHKREAKYVMAASGAAIIAAVKVDDWENPSRDLPICRVVLHACKPSVYYIPAGYANGFMTLTPDAKLFFFSTSTLDESLGDDIRFEANYWNPWTIIER